MKETETKVPFLIKYISLSLSLSLQFSYLKVLDDQGHGDKDCRGDSCAGYSRKGEMPKIYMYSSVQLLIQDLSSLEIKTVFDTPEMEALGQGSLKVCFFHKGFLCV